MGIWFIILILFLTILYSSFLSKEKKKYNDLKTLQDEELKKRYEEEFKESINKIKEKEKKEKEGIEQLEKQKKNLQQEIDEKQRFNSSLFKLREDELNRLIEEKKKEKEKTLEAVLLKEEHDARAQYTQKFSQWVEEQEKKKEESLNEFLERQVLYQQQIDEIKAELDEFQAKRNAINEQLRREEELANEVDFHRIILSSVDKEDISFLISIEQKIHNKEILYKLIWSEYIQKPFNQMIKNICGNNSHKNVIYCIENINNHKKYIGKTTAEVSKRWTEHVKNSLNIGGIKKQLVHEAMFGHWDEFTFSIIEEVQNEKIGEREKYYISFFETDKYGYNLKSGG